MKTTYQYGPGQIILEGIGQQRAESGDEVMVKASLLLPDNLFQYGNYFGYRLILFGENMGISWGIKENKHRIRTETFFGETWKEAKKLANDYAQKEVDKLIEAIATREKALIDAGNWE